MNLIMIASPKPGAGKTFCSVNLAASISLERELNVLLVDADVAKPHISDVFGLADESTYTGLAIDNNGLVLAFVFLLDGLVGRGTFAVILYITLLALAAMNVAPIRTPKLTGGWHYGLVVYALVMTAVFGSRWAQLP